LKGKRFTALVLSLIIARNRHFRHPGGGRPWALRGPPGRRESAQAGRGHSRTGWKPTGESRSKPPPTMQALRVRQTQPVLTGTASRCLRLRRGAVWRRGPGWIAGIR